MKDNTKMRFGDWLESKFPPEKVRLIMTILDLRIKAQRKYEEYLND